MGVPISNVTRRVVYAASGTGPYNFTFEILAASDIAVYRDDTLLTLTTDYTVTINANGTGFITLVASPTGATQIAIVGNRTISRSTDFTTGGDFFANTLNDELDQQTIFAQQNAEGLQRALQAPQTDPTTINMTLPRASVRASKVLSFDANGNPSATEFIGSNRGNWASGTLYYVRDIIKDTSTSNIWQCVVQHTSSGSQPIATNTDAAKWFLLVDAASAGASATAAANSATAAATSATNASNSASAASTSATNAASSASAASTSATNAASSASAASGSASTASTAATNAGNSATAAATSATNASNSASAASTSATNAANSASAASTSASNASTSATNAANSATSASTSASTATTQATNAANSATAAAASAAAAAASFDAFDDIYLGAKSSDPSVDNDGNALTTGDQYFNTSANELRVWNGSTWQAASTVGGTVTSLNVTGNTTLGDATADSVTVNAGTLNFAQTAQRIVGDFSNATFANRLMFQTSTANSSSAVSVLPSGTSSTSAFQTYNNSDPTNASLGSLIVDSGALSLQSTIRGTGTYLPMTLWTGGSERMRLDTSGNLGIGTSSPGYRLDVNGIINGNNSIISRRASGSQPEFVLTQTGVASWSIYNPPSSTDLRFYNGSDLLTMTGAGNLGLGVTPSAWGSGTRGLDIGSGSAIWNPGSGTQTQLLNNSFNNGTNFIYKNSGSASRYRMVGDQHEWYTAPSGTAGNAISFTQAMTLDASGNLLVGSTSGSGGIGERVAVTGGGIVTQASAGATRAMFGNFGSSDLYVGSFDNFTMQFRTNNIERMRIDTSGNVGIGTSSPSGKLEVVGAIRGILNSGQGGQSLIGAISGVSNGYEVSVTTGNVQNYYWHNGGTRSMTLDSSGNLLVGTTSFPVLGAERLGVVNSTQCFGFKMNNSSSTTLGGLWSYGTAAAGSGTYIAFYNGSGGSTIGSISHSASATAYNTSSDYRLKHDIQPMTGALAKVALLKPVIYKWNVDGSAGEGFIAHELQEVCPQAVTGEKDAVETYTDDDGNEQTRPKYQGIDTSFLVATLTAAIQEQQAIIQQLTARIEALEQA